MSRCVRRAYLCGQDSISGRSFEHRRVWLERRLAFLSRLFGVEVLAYSVMSNHWHGVLRTRPDRIAELSDEDLARRWLQLYPRKVEGSAEDREAAQQRRIQELVSDPVKCERMRTVFGSLSCFMASVNENIARRGNREDGVTGRFWEGRFKCQSLLDEAAILTCMVYVDLNPVRAKLAEGLEDSHFTSAYNRIKAREARQKQEALEQAPEQIHPLRKERLTADLRPELDKWLLSFKSADFPVAYLTEGDYLKLLDATGRCIRTNKKGAIDPAVVPVLESLDINVDKWVQGIERYGSLTYRVVGHIEAFAKAAARTTVKFFKGRKLCAELFGGCEPVPG
jgi:hypothetical protein